MGASVHAASTGRSVCYHPSSQPLHPALASPAHVVTVIGVISEWMSWQREVLSARGGTPRNQDAPKDISAADNYVRASLRLEFTFDVIPGWDGSDWWRYSVFVVGGSVESGNSTGGLVGGVEIEHE